MSFPPEFKGDILTPKDADFEKALIRFNISSQRRASVVAYVKDADDIILALRYAKENKLPIAVRGGGHSWSGSSSVDDGLVIDLSRYLTECRIDAEKKLAYVQGGAVWGTVERAAIKEGLATVSGNVDHTGVAGLALGGGYGVLSGQHGMSVDNIVQATVVTANGSILTANETENSDLFFGIRGGGSNFGVVTEFVFRLHPQRKTIYGGIVMFAASALEALVKALNQRIENMSEKEVFTLILTTGPDKAPIISLTLFYNGSESEGRAHYKDVFDLGPLFDKTTEMPYEKYTTLQNEMVPYGKMHGYMKSIAVVNLDYQGLLAAHDVVNKAAMENDMVFAAVALEFMNKKKIMSVPKDSTAFRRDYAHVGALVFMWASESKETLETVRSTAKQLEELLKNGQHLSESEYYGYGNVSSDADADKSHVMFGYNYPKLQQLKKKYDPEQVFNRWYPITPAA